MLLCSALSPDGVYNGQWTQQQKLVPHDAYIRGSGSLWGTKADMHGKTLVVGQSTEPTYGTNTGMVWWYDAHASAVYIIYCHQACE